MDRDAAPLRGRPHFCVLVLVGFAALGAGACSAERATPDGVGGLDTGSESSGDDPHEGTDSDDTLGSLDPLLCMPRDPFEISMSPSSNSELTCAPGTPTYTQNDEGVPLTTTVFDCSDEADGSRTVRVEVLGPTVDFGQEPVTIRRAEYTAFGFSDYASVIRRDSRTLAMVTSDLQEWRLGDIRHALLTYECCLWQGRWIEPFEVGVEGGPWGSVVTVLHDGHEMLIGDSGYHHCTENLDLYHFNALAVDMIVP